MKNFQTQNFFKIFLKQNCAYIIHLKWPVHRPKLFDPIMWHSFKIIKSILFPRTQSEFKVEYNTNKIVFIIIYY